MSQTIITVPVREALLRAGLRAAAREPLPPASAASVLAEAGLGEDALVRYFVDFEHYLLALQQRFLDELRDGVIRFTDHQPPGRERLKAGTSVYLDGCIKRRGLRQWLLEGRLQSSVVADGLRRQNQAYAMILSTEFHAMRWPQPQAAARLFLASVQEVSRIEHTAAAPVPAARMALWEFLASYG